MSLLILDIGSSSARALLFDSHARLIPGAVASRAYQYETVPPGAATFDASWLREQVEACIDEILTHPHAAEIEAVGVDTFVGNALGVDVQGAALTPVYLYADTRSADDVATLRDVLPLPPREMHQHTGTLLHTAYLPGRLAWLRRTQPEMWTQVHQWVDFGAYLYGSWLGEMRCSYSVASWTGMLNRARLTWDEVWLKTLDIAPSALPTLADYTDAQTGLRSAYAERWPALRKVPFYLPLGDGASANVGSGCVDRSEIALTVGTTAALRVITDEPLPPVPPGLWSYRVDHGLHLIGGATTEGGNVYGWALDTLRLDHADLDDQLAARAPGTHGLTFLPLLAGERSPGWRADATGTMVGLRLSTTPLDILQAAMEGVALRLALVAGQLQGVAASDATIIASGGAFKSRAWAGMIANAVNRPLSVTRESEITARGTAMLLLRALERGRLADFPPAIDTVIEPDPTRAAQMRDALERQQELYNALL
jgi:gluconokinase